MRRLNCFHAWWTSRLDAFDMFRNLAIAIELAAEHS